MSGRETDDKVNNEVLRNETFVAEEATVIFQTCLIVVHRCEKWRQRSRREACKVEGIFMIRESAAPNVAHTHTHTRAHRADVI